MRKFNYFIKFKATQIKKKLVCYLKELENDFLKVHSYVSAIKMLSPPNGLSVGMPHFKFISFGSRNFENENYLSITSESFPQSNKHNYLTNKMYAEILD